MKNRFQERAEYFASHLSEERMKNIVSIQEAKILGKKKSITDSTAWQLPSCFEIKEARQWLVQKFPHNQIVRYDDLTDGWKGVFPKDLEKQLQECPASCFCAYYGDDLRCCNFALNKKADSDLKTNYWFAHFIALEFRYKGGAYGFEININKDKYLWGACEGLDKEPKIGVTPKFCVCTDICALVSQCMVKPELLKKP